MSEPVDRSTLTGDTSHRVDVARTPISHPERARHDALNIRLDVSQAREAYGEHPPELHAAAARARQAQIADRVEELDGRILDLIVAAIDLLARRGIPTLEAWALVMRVRDETPDGPQLGPAMAKVAAPTGDTIENLTAVVAGCERVLEHLRNAFPKLTVRHST